VFVCVCVYIYLRNSCDDVALSLEEFVVRVESLDTSYCVLKKRKLDRPEAATTHCGFCDALLLVDAEHTFFVLFLIF
jgi:hypothetical protein